MRLFARSMMAVRWPPELIYRSAVDTNNAPNSVNKPTGIVAGDLVVVVFGASAYPTALATSGGDTWNRDASATNILCWKILNATDVANSWATTGAPNVYATAAAYADNGIAIASASVRSSADAAGSATSLTIPGFTMGAQGRPRAIIAAVSGGAVVGSNVIAPSGFTERTETDNPEIVVADAQRTYNYGGATFTGLQGTAPGTQSGWLLEVY